MKFNSRVILARGLLVLALVSLAIASGSLGYRWLSIPPRRSLEALPTTQRVVANAGGQSLSIVYKIRNTGNRPVTIGDISTTCGCSVASISSKRLSPGSEVEVLVRGEPPPVGEKNVEIRLATDAIDVPELVLGLVMVGRGAAPYVAFHSASVPFGSLTTRELPARRDVLIMTREAVGIPPWIVRVESTLSGLTLQGGFSQESKIDDRVIARTYQYSIVLERGFPTNIIDGRILVIANDQVKPILELPVMGELIPDVFSEPKAFYTNVNLDEPLPSLNFDLVGKGDGFDPVLIEPGSDVPPFQIKRVGIAPGRASFILEWTKPVAGDLSVSATFRTGIPEHPNFSIPIFIHRSTKTLGMIRK